MCPGLPAAASNLLVTGGNLVATQMDERGKPDGGFGEALVSDRSLDEPNKKTEKLSVMTM